MSLTVDTAWIALVLLASVRFGALFVLAPVFGGVPLPAQFRALFVLAMAATLVLALRLQPLQTAVEVVPLALAALSELAIGAAMAFGLFTAFGAFQFAGKLLDLQIGFSIGTVFDPVTRAQSPLLGAALNMLALVLFFALDGHHMMMRGVAYSLERVPPGSLPANWSLTPFVDQFGSMFVFGLVLVAPVVFALLLVDVGLGIVSRTMPQLNVFTVGIPAKIVVGLLLLAATLSALAPVMARVFASVFSYWQRLLN
ncbi:MAG TPA: flagellar biosynthetic protein FliR [Burkholderiaceae bacterium]|nr:flagellar biosynthetic protein FliR [Burkholderiaceae bacterium]